MTSGDTPLARRLVRTVMRWLIEPHPAIADSDDRSRMRVLSSLLLVASLVSALGFLILSLGQGPQRYKQEFLINSIPLAAGYLLSRTRHLRVTPALACLLPAVGVFASVVSMQQRDPVYANYALMWLFIPILLSGLVLSIRGTTLITALILAGLAATIELLPELSGETSGIIFGFILSIASITLVVAWVHQQNLARLREELTERTRAEAALAASLREKEVMLQEIHHRVKNNLQVVSSLLSLQTGQTGDEMALALLNDSRNRVRTMALIHENLYRSNNLACIDFADYTKDLLQLLIPAYETANHVTFNIQAEGVWLSLDSAVPCGLIVNELVSNALKHAFPDGREGTVELSARADGNRIRLDIADDGVGIPAGKDTLNGDTLGMQLVHSLVGQLDGELTITSENGMRCEITFQDGTLSPDYLTDVR